MEQHSGKQSHAGGGSATQVHAITSRQVTKEMHRCMKDCTDCHVVCRDTITYCLTKGGEHAHPDHIWLLNDCAEICLTSAHFMAHNSEHHHIICRACAEVCERCAEDCARFGDDQQMQACAEACRRCAASCREMAHA